jgi:LysM repeat protein
MTELNDSLLKLSFKFDLSIQYIKKLNNLLSDDIYPGQIIKIVDKEGKSAHLLANSEEELRVLNNNY